jgi:DMSO/TMAO reductase YedYZ molybdopterin-dependent catalytic subunit
MEGSKAQRFKPNALSPSTGMILRQREPRNLEAPFDQVDSYITPTDLFYIRCHFPTPELDCTSYQLRFDGSVRRLLVLSYDELRSMPAETRVARSPIR